MKIYVTRTTAFQLQCGGIDRLQVWFKRPIWVEPKFFSEDSHWWSEKEVGCYAPNGWGVFSGNIQHSTSFGGMFGYEGEIVDYVWSELVKHFGNKGLREWGDYEKENSESCTMRNFLLELNIETKLALSL